LHKLKNLSRTGVGFKRIFDCNAGKQVSQSSVYSGCHKYVPFAGFANTGNVCKNEEKLLERLDPAILDLIDNPEKTQQTTAIGTLF
jgi:hypothetical protein